MCTNICPGVAQWGFEQSLFPALIRAIMHPDPPCGAWRREKTHLGWAAR